MKNIISMNLLISGIVISFMLFLYPVDSSGKESQNKEKAKHIVCVLPLTGDYSVLGNMALRGVVTARETFGSDEYELVVFDIGDRDVNDALAEINENYDPALIVGPVPDSKVEELSRKYVDHRTPFLTFPVISEYTEKWENLIRFHYPVEMQTYNLVDFVSTNKRLLKYAILYPETKMGNSFRKFYRKALMKKGKKLSFEASYNPDTLDIESEIIWLKNVKPDVIFIPDGASRSSVIIKKLAAKRILFNVFFIGPGTWNSPAFKRDLDDIIDGVIYKAVFTDYIDMNGNDWLEFSRSYRSLFGTDPGAFEFRVYSATAFLIHDVGIDSTSGKPVTEKLKKKITDGNGYDIEISENGVDIYPGAMMFSLEGNEVSRIK